MRLTPSSFRGQGATKVKRITRAHIRGMFKPDVGFGMVEVVVSMFLLAVIAMAILPVIVSSLKASEKNISLTTGTQLVSEQMDVARGLATTCAAVTSYANETVGLLSTDPRGTVLQVHRQAGTCPAFFPSVITFTTWVTIQGKTTRLAQSETRIHVTAAS